MSEPLVTLVVAARNEERHLTACLDSILAQTVGIEQLQVLVVDGRSTDRTREIIAKYHASHPDQITWVDNPRQITPCAFNAGINAAKAPYIGFVSAHSTLAPDYVAACLAALARTGADDVGGPLLMASQGYWARAIAVATNSPFGVGNATWRYATEETYVDTIFPGMYRREVFERIGGFDEELVRNQDDELNFRLTQSGGKIFLTPTIKATYVNRASILKLWRQYYQYGYWKVRVIQKRGAVASWRHLVPAAFVLSLLIGLWAHIVFDQGWVLLWGIATAYSAGASLFAWRGGRQDGWRFFPVLPLLFLCLHLSYGIGFLQGVRRFRKPTSL